MNITKAFCLSIALFGASNMQAITNSDFVIQQDNTKINNYQTNRPEASKRLFVSQSCGTTDCAYQATADNAAWHGCSKTVSRTHWILLFILTVKMIRLFIHRVTSTPCGCAIPGAQVWPYVQLANKDAELKKCWPALSNVSSNVSISTRMQRLSTWIPKAANGWATWRTWSPNCTNANGKSTRSVTLSVLHYHYWKRRAMPAYILRRMAASHRKGSENV